MKENLIVFDIDDTLTKSENQHQLAYVETMKHFGITNVNQNWTDYKHMTDSFILKENYERNLSNDFPLSFIEAFENRMVNIILQLNPVIEIKGAKSMLETVFNNSNYNVCCATGSFLKPALIKLEQARIDYKEQLIVGSNTLFTREEIVKAAIEKSKTYYGVHKFKHIISFGDGIWDLQTAKNLGIHFVGVGNKNQEAFNKANIKYQLKDWESFNIYEIEKALEI